MFLVLGDSGFTVGFESGGGIVVGIYAQLEWIRLERVNYAIHLLMPLNELKAMSGELIGRTILRFHLMQPLILALPILAIPAPSIDPILLLIIPDLLLFSLMADSLGFSESLPLRHGFDGR